MHNKETFFNKYACKTGSVEQGEVKVETPNETNLNKDKFLGKVDFTQAFPQQKLGA